MATTTNPEDSPWEPIPDMIKARGGFPAVSIGKRIYVLGGQLADDSSQSSSMQVRDPMRCSSSVEMYDDETKRWSMMGPMLGRRKYGAAAALGKKILICGGICRLDDPSSHPDYNPDDNPYGNPEGLKYAELYDTETGFSSHLPLMHNGYTDCTAATVDNKVYVFDKPNLGSILSGQVESSGEVFDMDSQTWQLLPPMDIPKNDVRGADLDLTAVAVGKDIVVLGETFAGLFHTQTNTWSPLPAHAKTRGSSQSAVAVGNKIFLLKGADVWTDTNQAYVFDLKTRALTPFHPMESQRRYFAVTAIGNKLFVLGGYNDRDGFLKPGECMKIPREWRDRTSKEDRDEQKAFPDCLHCGRPDARNHCSACNDPKKYSYCNRECQVADWKKHKKVCKGKKKEKS